MHFEETLPLKRGTDRWCSEGKKGVQSSIYIHFSLSAALFAKIKKTTLFHHGSLTLKKRREGGKEEQKSFPLPFTCQKALFFSRFRVDFFIGHCTHLVCSQFPAIRGKKERSWPSERRSKVGFSAKMGPCPVSRFGTTLSLQSIRVVSDTATEKMNAICLSSLTSGTTLSKNIELRTSKFVQIQSSFESRFLCLVLVNKNTRYNTSKVEKWNMSFSCFPLIRSLRSKKASQFVLQYWYHFIEEARLREICVLSFRFWLTSPNPYRPCTS